MGPSWIYGPFIPGFEHLLPTADLKPLSTNAYIYALLNPKNAYFPASAGFVDVRDVAKAHIAALNSKPSSVVGRKRYLLVSPEDLSYGDAIELIAKERPDLKERLVASTEAPQLSLPGGVERRGLEYAVGFAAEEYTPWQKTVLDTVDSLVGIEKIWKEKGLDISTVTKAPF